MAYPNPFDIAEFVRMQQQAQQSQPEDDQQATLERLWQSIQPPQFESPTYEEPPPETPWERMGASLQNTLQFTGAMPFEGAGTAFLRGLLAGTAGGFSTATQSRRAEKLKGVDRRNAAANEAADIANRSEQMRYMYGLPAAAGMAKAMLPKQTKADDALIDEGMLKNYNYKNPKNQLGYEWLHKPVKGSPLEKFAPTYDPTAAMRTDFGGAGTEGADDIIEGFIRGDIPPTFNFRAYGPAAARKISAGLARRGWNQTQAMFKYKAQETFWKNLNSRQFLAIQSSSNTVMQGLQKWEELANELESMVKSSDIKKVRSLQLNAAKDWAVYGPEVQRKATEMWAMANDIIPELANVYQMGGVPTEQAMKIAAQTINPAAPMNSLRGQIMIARSNLNYRLNSFGELNPLTEGAQRPVIMGGDAEEWVRDKSGKLVKKGSK